MRIDASSQEKIIKVVYCGPGFSGKSTNLNNIRMTLAGLSGDIKIVDQNSERTLQLDVVLAAPLATIPGQARLEIVTVPGQSYYAATRKAILTGADGVVFVADSRREALDENIESMNEMLNNLRALGLNDQLPVVLQYNKQDLPTAVKREQLEPLMNVRGWPSLGATATDGSGVIDALRTVTELILARIPADAAPQSTAPASWLISCYRCQAMLEVPDASIGATYTCGVCSAAMQVIDTDRGLTSPSATAHREDSSYSMPTLPDTQGGALRVDQTPAIQMPAIGAASPAGGEPFILPGYIIVDRLDVGPHGERFRVRDLNGRSSRALVLSPQILRQPGYREGMDAYVRLAGQVKHPYVLPMTGMTQVGEQMVFLSSDPQDYEPLSVILARRRALAPPHAMGILRQVALALEEGARHGVVHGWLRPDVILVNPDGAVLLDELCIPNSHRFVVRESTGASAATEYYLAPEHLGEDARSDVRSDIFLLGAILFRMLTGEGLVTGYNAHDALHKIVTNGARALRTAQPGISRDLDQFYQRMVTTERRDRFQNYRELIDLFDRFGGGAQRQQLHLTQRSTMRSGNRGGMVPPPSTPHGTRGPAGGGTGTIRRTTGAVVPGTTTARRLNGNSPAGGTPRAQVGTGTGSYKNNVNKSAPVSSGPGAMFVLMVIAVVALVAAAVILIMTRTDHEPEAQHSEPTVPSATPSSEERQSPVSAAATPKPTNKQNLPSWMTPTPMNAESKSGNATLTEATAPAATPTQNISVAANVSEMAIQSLMTQGRYQDALNTADHSDPAERRVALREAINTHHDRRRLDIEAAIAGSTDLTAIKLMLAPALEGLGLPGDSEWANLQLAKATGRISAPSAPTGPVGSPVSNLVTPAQAVAATATITPRIEPSVQAYGLVQQNLASNQPVLAQQALAILDRTTPEYEALRAFIANWSLRAAVLGRAVKDRGMRLRLPHPITGDPWTITQVSDEVLTLNSAGASVTELTWGQIPLKEQIRLCQDTASADGARAEELRLAISMVLIGNDPVLAQVQLKKQRGGLDADSAKALDLLVLLGRRYEAVDLLQRAATAVNGNNIKAADEALDRLKRIDKTFTAPLADDIQKIEAKRNALNAVKTASVTKPVTAAADPDHVAFETANDLRFFPDRTGGWQAGKGMLANAGDGRVARRDLANARLVQIAFMGLSPKGVLAVDFRGARAQIDLGVGTMRCTSRSVADSKPLAVSIVPRAVNTLLMEFRPLESKIRIELNNGAVVTAVPLETADDGLAISAMGGAALAVNEVSIGRFDNDQQVAMSKGSVRQLGLEPIGDAYLDAPAIVLPDRGGKRSGISMPLRDNLGGLTFDVRGQGGLRIMLGRPDGSDGQWCDVQLLGAAVTMSLRVSWSANQLTISDGSGAILAKTDVTVAASHVAIIALQEATILSTPRSVIK